tara:strand:- start:2151 stop:3404 length:1254 start_codon:yes stop_codon:yes gene_type:complete
LKKSNTEKLSTNNPHPNLDFIKIEREIIQITEEIKKFSKASFMMKMRSTLLPEEIGSKGRHLDGSIVANKVKSDEITSLVSKIRSEPKSSASRVKLVRSIMRLKQEFPLSMYRDLMIQAALTIYLGDIAPATLQIAGQTYRLYLEKIVSIHKKNLVVIRSDQLKNVNLDLISIEDLVKMDEKEEIDENEELVLQEIKITLKLLEYTETLDEDTRSSITMSMKLDELIEHSSKQKVKRLFGSSGNTGSSKNKYMLIFRKTLASLEIIKRIPILHSIGLKIVSKLQEIDSKLPMPYLIEARLHMQALRILTLRAVQKDFTARPSMTPTFNKAIIAYHKALKRSSFTNLKPGDITVLAEFAQVSYYSYEQRKVLNLANHGVIKILQTGKKAVDALVPRNRIYLNKQKQINNALRLMNRFG